MRVRLLLAVLLLAACSGGPVGPAPPAPGATPAPADGTPTPPPTPTGEAGLRTLGTGMWLQNEPFSVAAATSADEWPVLWLALGQADSPPAVDFDREIVLFLGISGSSSCPERFERLVVDHGAGRVYAQWTRHDQQACTDDLQAQGVLIAVARAELPEQPFMLSLREQPICPDCAEHPDRRLVDPR